MLLAFCLLISLRAPLFRFFFFFNYPAPPEFPPFPPPPPSPILFWLFLGGVPPPRPRNGAPPPRGILEAEARPAIPELGERRGGGSARQPRADHQNVMLQLVRRVDELDLRTVPFPLRCERPVGNVGAQLHGQRSIPASTARGMEM